MTLFIGIGRTIINWARKSVVYFDQYLGAVHSKCGQNLLYFASLISTLYSCRNRRAAVNKTLLEASFTAAMPPSFIYKAAAVDEPQLTRSLV